MVTLFISLFLLFSFFHLISSDLRSTPVLLPRISSPVPHLLLTVPPPDPMKAIRESNNGLYNTTAPIDLNNMIHQYVEISGRGGLDSLQAEVFGMCLDGIIAYHHDVELHLAKEMMSGDDLVFLW